VISILAIGKYSYLNSLDLCLTARALGASEIIFTREKEPKIIRHMNGLEKKWGGKFNVTFVKSYKKVLKDATNYKKVYLTRYGMPINKLTYVLNTYKNIMLIVSFTEAPSKMLDILTDFNVSITEQPHCSIASIAIFLHDFYRGRELAMHFENAKYKVIPKEHGLSVVKVDIHRPKTMALRQLH